MRLTAVFGFALLLSGCLGTDQAYHPYREHHPTSESVESAGDRAVRTAIPTEVARHDWYLLQGEKEVGRIVGSVHRNPWNAYEHDMYQTLDDHAEPYLAGRMSAAAVSKPESDDAEPADEGGDDWGDEGTDDWAGGADDDWGGGADDDWGGGADDDW